MHTSDKPNPLQERNNSVLLTTKCLSASKFMYTKITIADTISMPIAAAICLRVIPKAGILIVGGFGPGTLLLTMLNTYEDEQFSHL
jgi:hypothetical protein